MTKKTKPVSTLKIEAPVRVLGMPKPSQRQWLEKLQASPYTNGDIDTYNDGELVTLLETRVANLLGKGSALFFTKGMMAQLAALKTAAEILENDNIILHPKSHIAFDEENAYKALTGLNGFLIGEGDTPFSLNEVENVKRSAAALIVELPLRRAGFKLPEWIELENLSVWCKDNNVHFHMDGARLWESTEFYQKSESEISTLFDSVYVSLYKGLGAMGGAILAGDEKFISACKVWRSRLCGDSFTSFPMIISALDGLDNRLKIIPELVRRAQGIALLLQQLEKLEVAQPQTNGFAVFLDGDIDKLNARAEMISKKTQLKLFNRIEKHSDSQRLKIEMQVGAEHELINDDEIVEYFSRLLR